ncbi:MAG: gamma carbonic anhydrase family protein [Candidatus Hadarchaeum sp.]|uniref:gamma carbonic anhydrase family protein n=1 Tax=Candidatus Hadarchaeum sp. TaxID=2883567 RepID=UPI003D14FD6D
MIESFRGKRPRIHRTAFVHPSATIIGDVIVGKHASIWPGAVVRADFANIKIGNYTNVQDNAVIHAGDVYRDGKPEYLSTKIGSYVIIGHNALIHGATIENQCLIGAGATVFNRATVKKGAMVGIGAVVLRDVEVPPRTVVVGIPARPLRTITDEEFRQIKTQAINYSKLAEEYFRAGSRSSQARRRWGKPRLKRK